MKIGDRLNNGAIILMKAGDKVLAFWERDQNPFVVWTVSDDGEAFWGHYHPDLPGALKTFNKKAGIAEWV